MGLADEVRFIDVLRHATTQLGMLGEEMPAIQQADAILTQVNMRLGHVPRRVFRHVSRHVSRRVFRYARDPPP